MGHEEHGGTWHMDAAQLDTQRKKGEAILKTSSTVFWSILEHMGHEEHGGTWHMDAAQLDTQRKKGEAILKTSSTVYSTNRSSPQLDRPSFNSIELRSQQSNPKNVASPLTFL
ncbi:unnamed protein product [Microthlaspi erraticum]|uniref:Uncharacterized protein n=1 Tax=Microthlaspi erraticum TaxID=1685480 RepID=A0A6D2JBX0_9BRAS|nr:unnamed protein product [Microthlaspi erraticum]